MTIEPLEQSVVERPSNIPHVERWVDRLVFDSAVIPGERIVKGTRLTAESLVAELAARSESDVLQAHPELRREDVEALRYYARTPVPLRRSFGG